jgi:hypothetical protein
MPFKEGLKPHSHLLQNIMVGGLILSKGYHHSVVLVHKLVRHAVVARLKLGDQHAAFILDNFVIVEHGLLFK